MTFEEQVEGLTTIEITDESIPTYIKTISEGENIIRGNDDKRVIKLVKPTVLREIIREFRMLIDGNVPPGTTKYITILE